jgi:hypothetical protein
LKNVKLKKYVRRERSYAFFILNSKSQLQKVPRQNIEINSVFLVLNGIKHSKIKKVNKIKKKSYELTDVLKKFNATFYRISLHVDRFFPYSMSLL